MATSRKQTESRPTVTPMDAELAKTHVNTFISALDHAIASHQWLDTSPAEQALNTPKTYITILREAEGMDFKNAYERHARALNALKTQHQRESYGHLTSLTTTHRHGALGVTWAYDSELAKIGNHKQPLAGITLHMVKPEEGNWVRLELTATPDKLHAIIPEAKRIDLGSTGLPRPTGRGDNRFHAENIVTMMHNVQKSEMRLFNGIPAVAIPFPSTMRADLINYLYQHQMDRNTDYKIEEREGKAPLVVMPKEKLTEIFGPLRYLPPEPTIAPHNLEYQAPSSPRHYRNSGRA